MKTAKGPWPPNETKSGQKASTLLIVVSFVANLAAGASWVSFHGKRLNSRFLLLRYLEYLFQLGFLKAERDKDRLNLLSAEQAFHQGDIDM